MGGGKNKWRKGAGRAVGCPATFVYFEKTVFVRVAVRTPTFTYFMTFLADTAVTSNSVASYVMQIDTVCYNRSASNKMERNSVSLTMTNEASYPVMKFVLRHAYATSAFTFVRAHTLSRFAEPPRTSIYKIFQRDTLSRGELRLHYLPNERFVVARKI